MRTKAILLAFVVLMGLPAAAQPPLYRDPTQPVERRIDDLLGRMALKEKIGQLNMPCVYLNQMGRDIPSKMAACRRFAEGVYTDEIGPGGGFFTLANNILPDDNAKQAIYFNELQRIAIEKTRLGIPLLQSEEGTHGVMSSGKTVFPEGLALGSTWNMDLIRRIYSTEAMEARAVGIHAEWRINRLLHIQTARLAERIERQKDEDRGGTSASPERR